MFRSAYACLIRLHPQPFRRRFGDEMLLIFEASAGDGGRWSILGDALLSLSRQWLIRPGSWKSPLPAPVREAGEAGLRFYLCGDDRPGRGPLMSGGLLAIVAFGIVGVLLTLGGHRAGFLIGSQHPSPSHLLAAGTNAPPGDLSTEVKVRAYPDTQPMSAYFRVMLVLAALDRNRDGLISTLEMDDAPAALRSLDKNHDAKLSAEECGFDIDHVRYPLESLKLRLIRRSQFMRLNPVLAALDSNHDGVISASEMAMAAAGLKPLDWNRDGRLTENELLPDPVETMAARIVMSLDKNHDGVIGPDERTDGLRELLERADRNRDGQVTEAEIVEDYRRQSMRKAPSLE